MSDDHDLVPEGYWSRLNERLTGKCCARATQEERSRCVQVCNQVRENYLGQNPPFNDEAHGAFRCAEEIIKEAPPEAKALTPPFDPANGFYQVMKDPDSGAWAVRQLGYRRFRAVFTDDQQGEADANTFANLLNGEPPPKRE